MGHKFDPVVDVSFDRRKRWIEVTSRLYHLIRYFSAIELRQGSLQLFILFEILCKRDFILEQVCM
jgi:hypothetical protein